MMKKTDDHKGLEYQETPLGVNLDRAEMILSALFQKIKEPIFWVGPFGKIELASIEAAKLFGPPFLEERFWDRFKDEEFGFSVRETLRYGMSHPLLHKQIGGKDFEIRASYVGMGVLVMLRDVSSLRRLIEVQGHADQMRTLGLMAASFAHEMRNPLSGIRGFASLLEKDLIEAPHLQEMASQVVIGAKILDELATSVLEYARPLRLKIETVDLAVLIRQISRLFQADPSFPSNIMVELHIPQAPILAPLDAAAMQRALLNLLINAKEAMPAGGKIQITLFKEGEKWQIGVADSGIGMTEQELSSLFTPHFTTKGNGNGLGLVETKKIIEAHGAKIEARSYPNKGAAFTITCGMAG